MAAKSKKVSSHSVEFAKGGNKSMFGPQTAGSQKPGVTSKSGSSDSKFAKGGSGKMFGFQGSQPAQAGKTGAR